MNASLTARATRTGGSLVQHLRSRLGTSSLHPAGAQRSASGWLAVTVLCDPADLDETPPPPPLDELADRIEVRVRPAAGGKGTELAARLKQRRVPDRAERRLSGSDAEGEVRSALRKAKQLVEVGEVLVVDPAPHGQRTATPGGALLESWTRSAGKGGVR